MADIQISINGRVYNITCDDGQEQRVYDLAAYVDGRLSTIKQASGAQNDAHLLVLTSLIMADELQEALQSDPLSSKASIEEGVYISSEEEEVLAQSLDKMASRIQDLSKSLKKIA